MKIFLCVILFIILFGCNSKFDDFQSCRAYCLENKFELLSYSTTGATKQCVCKNASCKLTATKALFYAGVSPFVFTTTDYNCKKGDL